MNLGFCSHSQPPTPNSDCRISWHSGHQLCGHRMHKDACQMGLYQVASGVISTLTAGSMSKTKPLDASQGPRSTGTSHHRAHTRETQTGRYLPEATQQIKAPRTLAPSAGLPSSSSPLRLGGRGALGGRGDPPTHILQSPEPRCPFKAESGE